MKLRKLLGLIFVILLALALVACGGESGTKKPGKKQEADPLVPTAISLKVKVAKVQINNELKMTYTITPATAQNDEVKVTLDKANLATVAKSGNNQVVLTAGSEIGNVKVTVETSNGLKATKTIKIQTEAVESYPDLSGYTIKLAQAEHALGSYDVKLTQDTKDKYGYYGGADKDFKVQAWDEIEDNYNCVLQVVAYPSDAPWGPSRWQYILTQAQNDAPEYDFYVCPDGQIPGFVAGNAILDLTDWYAQYGKNLMNDMTITASTYKQRLYAINEGEVNTYVIMGYNVGLLEKLQAQDDTIKNPAQMFLDGEWNYDTFKEYCLKVQTAMNTLFGEEESYYALSGYGVYYWTGLVNAAGVKVLDTTQLKANITGATETLAAQTLQEIYAAGAMDPAFQVDEGVASWNNGHALFNTGDFWFVNASDRWNKTLWGEDTRYGYVPYPTSPTSDHVFFGTTTDSCLVMAAGRDWAYRGFGEDCTAENIYRAYMDYLISARTYYTTSDSYDKYEATTALASGRFGDEQSIKAYLRVIFGTQQEDGSYEGGIDVYGFYDPFVSNSNSVVGCYGASGTFAGSINDFIKDSSSSQWIDAVGSYQSTIEKSIVDSYG